MRIFAGAILLALILGLTLYQIADPSLRELEQLVERDLEQARIQGGHAFRYIVIGMTVVTGALALYFGWIGYRILSTGHSPPLGSRVVEGQRFFTGRTASLIGWSLLGLTVVFVVAQAVFLWFALGVLETLENANP